MEILLSLIAGLAGAGLLSMIYAAARFKWPDSYVSLADTFQLRTVSRLPRLIMFRFVPTFLVAALTGVSTERLSGKPLLAISVTILIHVVLTNGRAAVRAMGKHNRDSRLNYGSYHIVTSLVVVASGGIALWTIPFLKPFVPRPSALVEAVWTAAFVAVLGAFVLRVTNKDSNDERTLNATYMIGRARKDVGVVNEDYAYSAAIKAGADPLLLRALMFTESLQRPRWVRNFERFKGRFLKGGTYGVMQVQAAEPISDAQSIDLTAQEMKGSWGLEKSMYGAHPDWNAVWASAGHHHGDRVFIDMVTEIYRELLTCTDPAHPVGQKRETSLPYVEIRRYATQLGIRGIASTEHVTISYTTPRGMSEVKEVKRPIDVNAGGWWAFEAFLPASVRELRASAGPHRYDLDLRFESWPSNDPFS